MITLKQNDTGLGLKGTLLNGNGPVDLTGANVLFLMDKFIIYPEVIDAANGQILVVFEKEHTLSPGIFKAEFEVQFSDGRIETFPNDDYLKIKIMNDLGGR